MAQRDKTTAILISYPDACHGIVQNETTANRNPSSN